MEFRILGPFDVVKDGEALLLGSGRQRALLAFLLLNANHAVSIEHLVDELWGDKPPERAVKMIQTYVSRLRKVLPEGILVTRPPGYVAQIELAQLDLHRFERALGEGQRKLAANEPAAASTVLGEALQLWRGPALVEFASEPFAQSEGHRLEELRLVAVEERIEADLLLGRHADLVGELESLVAHHPLRERFRAQLMLALYRSGRQVEALTAYRNARSLFVDELGIEPSRSLHDLQTAILRQDPSLDVTLGAPGHAAPVSVAEKLGGFVGREQELGRLRDVLEGALSGSGRLVMLSGEPGIGKTRTAIELAAYAEEQGARVLWGRCYEREGAPPYWPWLQAIRAYVNGRDLGALRSELGSQAATVAEIVPEVRERLSDLELPPVPSDPSEARFRLLDSVASFLKRASHAQPLVIVLDDVHGADAGSLLLLEFVARELAEAHLLLIGTYLDVELTRGHPLAETLAELTRERLFERVSLRGLTEEEVARFIEATIGLPPPRELARAVHRQAEGNPLFMTEVVRLLVQEQALTEEPLDEARDWSLRLPEGVKQVIGRRLDRLSPECNHVLRLASVIGREFSLGQLATLIDDRSGDELLTLIEEALTSHVVEELPESVGTYRFTHTLVQETLVEELSTTRRVRLHARVGEALEQFYGDEVDAHAAELAHHFAESETVLGSLKLIRYSRIAGESALAAHAYDQGLTAFKQALAAKEGQPMDDETAAILFGLARCELAVGERYDLNEALGHMRSAFDHYAESGDEQRAVEIAVYPIPPLYVPNDYTAYLSLADRALAMVSPSSPEVGRLLSTLGWFTGLRNYKSAGLAFQRSYRIAYRLGDNALEGRALVNDAHVDFWHLRWQGCLEKSLRAIELAVEADDYRTEMVARSFAMRMHATMGESKEAAAHTVGMLEQAERFRERYWLVTARVNPLWLAVLMGDWQAGRRLSEEGLALQSSDVRNLGARALLESQVGDFARAEVYADRLQQARRLSARGFPIEDAYVAGCLPLLANIAGADERLAQAGEAAEAARSGDVVLPLIDLFVTVGQGFTAVLRRDAAHAQEHRAALAPLSGTAFVVLCMTVDRLLGLLARTAGQLEDALAHFEDGLTFCRRAGYRPEYAWTAYDYAEALLDRGWPGDLERSAAMRVEALAVADELGMQPLIDRAGVPGEA
jgi:DNA-binding SARP family transcriptional activator/tetratricopeptide (TPR) repeat protein